MKGYAFYQSLGSPKYVCAPMVDQSELAFRMLTRRYGTQLCYTPMLHSRMMVEAPEYKNKVFTTCPEDRPLVAQFCANNPDTLLKAARLVENECDAVDINLGCPQGIARKGHYGSFLLQEKDLIVSMVENLAQNLSIPVLCKIRILPAEEDTMNLVRAIEKAGCSILTVHGRTKEQNKDRTGTCDWDIIKRIKAELSIPVFANGGIYTFEDVQRCLEYTKCDGVMSSEALLENPALFSGQICDLNELAIEYLELAKEHSAELKAIKAHLFKMLYQGLKSHHDLREKLHNVMTYDQMKEIAFELKEREKDTTAENKFGWYWRHGKAVDNVVKRDKQDPLDETNDLNVAAEVFDSNMFNTEDDY
mmetsp:Transcript_32974/g.37419  ORF Transcript_32974/g.37419 Transcript_32974/m.37419 type:complete len:362 (-) Transcript_32974:18-1103(-)